MTTEELKRTLDSLVALPKETEWVEFKKNFHSPDEIGERLSAISNSACLLNKDFGYLVFGVVDETHEIVGTTFCCKEHKKGNEELELWLLNRLAPRIDIELYEFGNRDGSPIRLAERIGEPSQFPLLEYISQCTRYQQPLVEQ